MKKLLALATVASVLTLGLIALLPGASATADPKVIVCKYVANENAPGGEVFGQVIDVSANSLDGFDASAGFPQTFTDDQGSSVAVRFANGPGDKGDEVADCGQPVSTTTSPPFTTNPPPPPPCEDENGRPIECPTTTTAPPPTTTTPAPAPPPSCKGTVGLGPWYGDPRINITLTGAGTFVVSGGVQRFSDLTTITKTLACGETFKVGRYKVARGHYLTVTQDGVQVVYVKPPRLR